MRATSQVDVSIIIKNIDTFQECVDNIEKLPTLQERRLARTNRPPFSQKKRYLTGYKLKTRTQSKWIRDQMTLSMAGYKTGIFTHKDY